MKYKTANAFTVGDDNLAGKYINYELTMNNYELANMDSF
jgi:hypothetical protein